MELVQSKSVETQEDLLALLKNEGFTVTQATISRDIKELRLVKTLGSDGRYRYAATSQEIPDYTSKFFTLFADSVVKVENGLNTVCIQCHVGMAQAVCASMDTMHFDGVIGTLAGEDTIFVLCRSVENAVALVGELNMLFGR